MRLCILLLLLTGNHNVKGNNWSLHYQVEQLGPKQVFKGYVRLKGPPAVHLGIVGSIPEYNPSITTDPASVCFEYGFVIQTGVLQGPETSSSPGKPFPPFDEYTVSEGTLQGIWCETLPGGVDTIRYFVFHVVKQTFDGQDLAEMLSEWQQDGHWDLNGDAVVDGNDLSILLSHWE